MRKWIITFGSIGLLLLFIAVMGSGAFLKKPIIGEDDVLKQFDQIEESISKNNWSQAGEQMNKQFTIWEKVKNRLQFSVERDIIEEIDHDLAVLKGAIQAKDKKLFIEIVEKIKVIWNDLGK